MYDSNSRLEPDSLSQLPPNESTIVQVLCTATETIFPSIINPSMNEAIEFQEERINALEGRRIIDVEAN